MKALALLSGGLDSMLAARLIMDQGIEVIGVSFVSPFFGAEGATVGAAELGIELIVIDITDELFRTIERPKHGYGKHMNPCIDCHALMVRTAGEKLEELGASFIVTGEVVGQRPKSQMRFGLGIVEQESGIRGKLLRPLSAKLLAPTVPELEGWVDREKLLGLHGRTRKPQIELAQHYGIKEFASPAGGCLLTDENFARALRDTKNHGGFSTVDVRLISMGRQFRLSKTAKFIVGRNHAENERLFELEDDGVLFVKAAEYKGPVGVFVGDTTDENLELAARIVARYADTGDEERVAVQFRGGDAEPTEVVVEPFTSRQVKELAV
ncbi:tRNA 4-thiouridine(8) synthase ThiI [bacterium]|nr:tRNA 4-thiouridine(8) synthase ThiI [bacterium]